MSAPCGVVTQCQPCSPCTPTNPCAPCRPCLDNLTAVLCGCEDLRLDGWVLGSIWQSSFLKRTSPLTRGCTNSSRQPASSILRYIKEQRPIPVPKDDEVLIEIDCVGICGSDIHMVAHGPTGDCPPVILGHEASGTVACVGRCVTKLKRGDRVAIEPAVPCRMCQFCSLGCYDLCCTMTLYGCGPKPGSLARYYAHPADYCHLLPDHLTMEEGAMIEPLAIAVHANRRAGVTCGSKVLICGAGTMGLLCLLAAKAMGACQVVVIDHIEHRLNVARCIGADFTVLVAEGCHCDKNIANTIHCLLHCEPPIAIECWGTEMGARIAILATRAGGCVVFVGMSSPCVRIPLTEACCKEIDLRGISRYANDFACALAYVCARQINVAQLITHRFTLEQTHVAFQTARDGCGNPIKVMIYCKRNWCCCT